MYIYNLAVFLFQTKSNAEDTSENNSSIKYDECNLDDWVCTNTTMKWNNDTKYITIICQSNELVKKLLIITLPLILHQ